MTRQRLQHDEDGWILVTSIILLTVMVSLALASFAFVDSGQKRTREQRERETSLNVTEGVLYSQGFALAQKWPGNATAGAAMPTTCTQTAQAAALQQFCPTPGTLAAANGSPATANFANVDALANVTWTTRIRDNGGPSLANAYVNGTAADATQSGTNVKTGAAYSCPGPCKWDANGDRQMWVEARGVVRGKPRDIVALLKREQFAESFPRNGVVAGSFETTNSGNKTIIDATGSQVVVRCTSNGSNCTDYQQNKNQVLPTTIVHDASYPASMSQAQLARFKTAAQTSSPSTYYTSCPSTFTGTVVYIDVPTGTNCMDVNGETYNSEANPGIVIMPRGTLGCDSQSNPTGLKGTYYAILYLANEQQSSGKVLCLGSNTEIYGGVAIDGLGRLDVGQSSGPRPTITFRDNAFNSLGSFGTTGLVQNTWRELPAS
jgi:Tfp pilus assembly protein PilX